MKKNKRHFPKGLHERGYSRHRHKHKRSGWFSEMMGRRAPRIERGEIRYLILDTLTEKGRHGYDIMQTIQEKTGGMYLPSSGTLYPALQMLQDLELIFSKEDGKRRVYELTEKGKGELENQRLLLDEIYEDMGQGQSIEQSEFLEEIHDQVMNILKTIARSFQLGRLNPAKAEKIREIVNDTFNRVDETLKED